MGVALDWRCAESPLGRTTSFSLTTSVGPLPAFRDIPVRAPTVRFWPLVGERERAFAIKASVAANFLQDNSIKFQIGEATQALKAPDLADEAKALSAYIECR